MIDIVTVVFRDELPVLQLQAQSVDLYCRDIGVKNIFVVVNDDESVVAEINTAWWGSLGNCVRIIPRTLLGSVFVDNGWVSQQALKLAISKLCENPWYTVLDAKTIFVRPLKLTDVFDSKQKLQVGQLDIYPVFERSRQITNELFGIDLKRQAGPGGVPFFLNTNDVRAMVAYIENKVKESFVEWFQAQGMLTEFILYSGWIEYRHGLNVCYSSNSFFTVCNICHSEVGIANSKLSSMKDPGMLTVSIHRNAWTQFTEVQKQTYRDFLKSRGINKEAI